MDKGLRALLVEDSEDDALLLTRELRRGGYEPLVERVDTAEAMAAALDRQAWDIVICDYVMPHFSAPDALSLLEERDLDLPFIIVSGAIGEEAAVKALNVGVKAGAQDFIMKNRLARLVPAIERELREFGEHQERIQAEEALRQSEARYRALFDNTSDSIVVRDLEGNIIMANNAMADLTGYAIDALMKMNISHLFSSSSFENIMEKQDDLLNEDEDTSGERYEITLIQHDKSERIVESRISLLTDDGQTNLVLATMRDVTSERRARDAIRAYALQITQAQEAERKRIARELHDETIQDLAGIGMTVDSLMNMHSFSSKDDLNRLEDLRNSIDGALQRLRYLTQDLRPPMLEALGLIESLQWLIDNLRVKSGIDATLEVTGEYYRFPPDTEVMLFRIAQEALNNVRKHSRANEATVKMEFMPQKTILSIRDNGQGFKLNEKVGDEYSDLSKLGLIGMQERARLLGGTLMIESEIGKGTTVAVEIQGT